MVWELNMRGRVSKGGSLLLAGLLLLFCLPYLGAQEASEMTTEEIINELLMNLEEREKLLSERESLLMSRESNLRRREEFLEKTETSLDKRRQSLDARESSLSAIKNSLQSYDAALQREIWIRNGVIVGLSGLLIWSWLR